MTNELHIEREKMANWNPKEETSSTEGNWEQEENFLINYEILQEVKRKNEDVKKDSDKKVDTTTDTSQAALGQDFYHIVIRRLEKKPLWKVRDNRRLSETSEEANVHAETENVFPL